MEQASYASSCHIGLRLHDACLWRYEQSAALRDHALYVWRLCLSDQYAHLLNHCSRVPTGDAGDRQQHREPWLQDRYGVSFTLRVGDTRVGLARPLLPHGHHQLGRRSDGVAVRSQSHRAGRYSREAKV